MLPTPAAEKRSPIAAWEVSIHFCRTCHTQPSKPVRSKRGCRKHGRKTTVPPGPRGPSRCGRANHPVYPSLLLSHGVGHSLDRRSNVLFGVPCLEQPDLRTGPVRLVAHGTLHLQWLTGLDSSNQSRPFPWKCSTTVPQLPTGYSGSNSTRSTTRKCRDERTQKEVLPNGLRS